MHLSYLEIYNDVAYDLLDESDCGGDGLDQLKKVTLRANNDNEFELVNLSRMPVTKEDDAMQWLYTGETNRMMASTSSNPDSSRGHCIFIVQLETKIIGDARVRKSKLQIVDLAG